MGELHWTFPGRLYPERLRRLSRKENHRRPFPQRDHQRSVGYLRTGAPGCRTKLEEALRDAAPSVGVEWPRMRAHLGRAVATSAEQILRGLLARGHNWRIGVRDRVCGLRRGPYGEVAGHGVKPGVKRTT